MKADSVAVIKKLASCCISDSTLIWLIVNRRAST